MKAVSGVLVALVAAVVLVGCGGGDDAESGSGSSEPSSTATPTEPEVTDVSSGRALSEFEGSPTYEFRKNLATQAAAVLADLRAINPGLGRDSDLTDVISLCSDIAGGLAGDDLTERTQERFEDASTDGTGELSDGDADRIVAAVQKSACPA